MVDRRQFVRATGLAAVAGLAGCSEGQLGGETDDGTETPFDGTQLTLNNVGQQAWELTDDESGDVGPTGEENPTLTFTVGERYLIQNDGWSSHPFAIRAADDSPLVSQDADGSLEDAVDWTDDGDTVAFTFTQELADEADYYICTTHPSMRGSVSSN